MISTDLVDKLERFHAAVFGKNAGVMWGHLQKDPHAALLALVELAKNPNHHTFETGFILGAVLCYGLQVDPLRVRPFLESFLAQVELKKVAETHGR